VSTSGAGTGVAGRPLARGVAPRCVPGCDGDKGRRPRTGSSPRDPVGDRGSDIDHLIVDPGGLSVVLEAQSSLREVIIWRVAERRTTTMRARPKTRAIVSRDVLEDGRAVPSRAPLPLMVSHDLESGGLRAIAGTTLMPEHPRAQARDTESPAPGWPVARRNGDRTIAPCARRADDVGRCLGCRES
jgi:hypothetical protein